MLSPLLLLVEFRGRCATRGRAWNSTTPPRYGETDSLRIQTQPAFYAPLQMSSRAVDGAVACTQDREKAGNPPGSVLAVALHRPPTLRTIAERNWANSAVVRFSGGTGGVAAAWARQKRNPHPR